MTFSEIVTNSLLDAAYTNKGFKINENDRIVEIIEVEDTNPISINKMREITNLWFRLDVGLILYSMDRYGTSKRELDLAYYYLAFLKEDSSKTLKKVQNPKSLFLCKLA